MRIVGAPAAQSLRSRRQSAGSRECRRDASASGEQGTIAFDSSAERVAMARWTATPFCFQLKSHLSG